MKPVNITLVKNNTKKLYNSVRHILHRAMYELSDIDYVSLLDLVMEEAQHRKNLIKIENSNEEK